MNLLREHEETKMEKIIETIILGQIIEALSSLHELVSIQPVGDEYHLIITNNGDWIKVKKGNGFKFIVDFTISMKKLVDRIEKHLSILRGDL